MKISDGGDGACRSSPDRPAVGQPGQALGITPVPSDGLRILVVDDNLGGAEGLSQVLGLWGHETRLALSGPEAITCARSFRPQVVLLDLCLPGMDGFAVARVLREDPGFDRTRVLAITGDRDEGDDHLAQSVGIDRIFLKPLNFRELEADLARLSDLPDRMPGA